MQVDFKTKKLRKQLTQKKELQKLGDKRSKKVMLRLTQIEAADNLTVLKTLPGTRLHPLKGNRKGQFSVDLDHPYRLLFEADHNPVPSLESGGYDWNRITKVKILEIADTHE